MIRIFRSIVRAIAVATIGGGVCDRCGELVYLGSWKADMPPLWCRNCHGMLVWEGNATRAAIRAIFKKGQP